MPLLRLRFLNGSRRGREAVFGHSPVRIGRSRENDLVLPEADAPSSSARHAEARYESGRWWIVDLESTNGTLVNDVRVQRAALASGDRLSLGDQILAVDPVGMRRGWFWSAAALLAVIAGAGAYLAWRSGGGPLDAIAARATRSTFLIVLQDGARRIPVGTAFAVSRAGDLATNAHVAEPVAAALAGSRPGVPHAIPDRGRGRPLRITGVTVHPGWTAGSIGDDVAILRSEAGASTTPVQLANADALARLRPGDPIAIFGFPAAFTDPVQPRGSLAVNAVREVRGDRYLVVGISVAPGASGSPVFTYDGVVAGLIAGSGKPHANGREWDATRPAIALTTTSLRELLK